MLSQFFGLEEVVDLNIQTTHFTAENFERFRGFDKNVPIGVVQSQFFIGFHRSLLTRHIIETVTTRTTESPLMQPQGIYYLLQEEIYTKFYYLHEAFENGKLLHKDSTSREYLHKNWVWRVGIQPLEIVREYFGEKIALYFAFCGFYSTWLIFASVFGLITIFYGISDWNK